jgi:hypothetical protein
MDAVAAGIGERGFSPCHHDRVEERRTHVRGDHHLVAAPDSKRTERKVKSRCPAGGRSRVGKTDGGGEGALERGDLPAADKHAALNDSGDCPDIVGMDERFRMGNHGNRASRRGRYPFTRHMIPMNMPPE